jgi:hypothetical protein
LQALAPMLQILLQLLLTLQTAPPAVDPAKAALEKKVTELENKLNAPPIEEEEEPEEAEEPKENKEPENDKEPPNEKEPKTIDADKNKIPLTPEAKSNVISFITKNGLFK